MSRAARAALCAALACGACGRASHRERRSASATEEAPEPPRSEEASASAAALAAVEPLPPLSATVEPAASSGALAVVPPASASASALPPGAPAGPPTTLSEKTFGASFDKDPLYFSPAFDGSMRFALWADVMRFARAEEKRTKKRPHFTFFVNAVYYSTHPGHSEIGTAHSDLEVLVRRALTQEALNEGHDIGSHGVGHDDGRAWSKDQWNAEFSKFEDLMISAVFEPIENEDGSFVFPRFAPKSGAAAGEPGASCATDDDCASRQCLAVSDRDSFCTVACNMKKPCPEGLACGAPAFQEDTDVCLPPPKFPIEYDGKTLFFANGTPNFKHPALKIHHYAGYRAPFLASNDPMVSALIEHGFTYDTSQASSPRGPYALAPAGDSKAIFEFPLMPHAGARSIPMDYNYRMLKVPREEMVKDYEAALVASYKAGHTPWNVGHHFATWDDGAYLKALFETVSFALDGCPVATPGSDAKEMQCPGAEVISFRELAGILRKKGASLGRP